MNTQRNAIAALELNAVLALRGQHWPRDARSLVDILALGVVNTVAPFALITWREKYIPSRIVGVLQGTAVLFSMLIAHASFADERMTVRKLVGSLTGFLGVVLLAGQSSSGTASSDTTLHVFGQLAIIATSLCYAVGGGMQPLTASAGAMTVAAVYSGLAAYGAPSLTGAPVALSQLTAPVAAAIGVLGLWNAFGAYLIYYSLIARLGAARTSMVAYLIPVVSLLLGVISLHETLDAMLLLGAALITGGIALVSLKAPFRKLMRTEVTLS